MSCNVKVNDPIFNNLLELHNGDMSKALVDYIDGDVAEFNRLSEADFEKLSPLEKVMYNVKEFESSRVHDLVKSLRNKQRQGFKNIGGISPEEQEIVNNIALLTHRKNMLKDMSDAIAKGALAKNIEYLKDIYDLDAEYVTSVISDPTYAGYDPMPDPEKLEILYKTIKRWFDISDFNDSFMDRKELSDYLEKNERARAIFNGIRTEAFSLMNKLNRLRAQSTIEMIAKTTKQKVDADSINAPATDVNWFAGHLLDVTTENSPLAQAIGITTKQATVDAKTQVINDLKALDDLTRPAMKAAKELGYENLWDAMSQRDEAGNMTGALVDVFSKSYWTKRNNILRKSEKSGSYTGYLRFAARNELLLDPNLFRPLNGIVDQKALTTHIQSLMKHSGMSTDDMKALVTEMYQKLNIYEAERVHAEAMYGKDTFEYNKWVVRNSPYVFNSAVNDIRKSGRLRTVRLKDGDKYVEVHAGGGNAVVAVPVKKYSNGKASGHYDTAFDKIKSNDDLYNFWKFSRDLTMRLHKYLPYDKEFQSVPTAIPFLHQRTSELLFDGDSWKSGAIAGQAGSEFYSTMMEALRSDNIDEVAFIKRVDPISGDTIPHVQSAVQFTNKTAEAAKVASRKAQFMRENDGKEPDFEEMTAIRDKVRSEIFEEQSPDLSKVLKYYALLATTYRYKAQVEDSLKMMIDIYKDTPNIKTNALNKPYINATTKAPVLEGERTNANNRMTEHFNHFLGYKRKREGKLPVDIKALTTEEKKLRKELKAQLDALPDDVEYDPIRAEIQKQLDEIGGVVVGSGIIDIILKIFQLKGLGWNVPAALANMGFGQIGNYRYGAKGLEFTEDEIDLATGMVLRHSARKNATFNKVNTPTAQKIRSVMDKFDILKDSSSELYKSAAASPVVGKLRWLNPYQANQRAEYLNQAPVMIAVMLHDKIKHNGETISVWDAIDQDGNILPQYTDSLSEERLKSIKFKIDEVIKKIHGNYDPDLLISAKRRVVGRALVQFKTWMFEGYNSRWSGEYHNSLLGRKDRGRYMSYVRAGKAAYSDGGIHGLVDVTFKTLLESTKRAAGFAISMATLNRIKGRKLLDKAFKADYNKYLTAAGYDEIDTGNMYANASELAFLMLVGTFVLMLKSIETDDDETRWALNFIANEGIRITGDLEYYYSPLKQVKAIQDPIASTGLIREARQWWKSAAEAINDGETDQLKYRTLKILPFTGSFIKMQNQGERIYSNRIY